MESYQQQYAQDDNTTRQAVLGYLRRMSPDAFELVDDYLHGFKQYNTHYTYYVLTPAETWELVRNTLNQRLLGQGLEGLDEELQDWIFENALDLTFLRDYYIDHLNGHLNLHDEYIIMNLATKERIIHWALYVLGREGMLNEINAQDIDLDTLTDHLILHNDLGQLLDCINVYTVNTREIPKNFIAPYGFPEEPYYQIIVTN
jgi:hypothetical protein